MSATPSSMSPLGTSLPSFSLPDLDGRLVSSRDFAGVPLLVAFICPHCPYVRHIGHELARFANEYQPRGLKAVAINSNDTLAYPQDNQAGMRNEAQSTGYTFPYLFDETQDVARAFGAACTPDLFLFDSNGRLAYRGQFDDSRPRTETPVTGRDVRAAVDALLSGAPVPAVQKPSVGCNIKWKGAQR